MSFTLKFMILVIVGIGGTWLSILSELKAERRRAERLRSRERFDLKNWMATLKIVPESTVIEILTLIGSVLDVPYEQLRPADSFAQELVLADRFWCLVVDDDTIEEICDECEEHFGFRPDDSNWENLEDVVLSIWQLTCENS